MIGFLHKGPAHRLLHLIMVGGLLGYPTLTWGEGSPVFPEARSIMQRGTIEIGAVTGYLQGVKVLSGDSANRTAVYFLPRVGIVVTDELKFGYLSGNLTLLVEPLYAHYVQPFGASAAGGAMVARSVQSMPTPISQYGIHRPNERKLYFATNAPPAAEAPNG